MALATGICQSKPAANADPLTNRVTSQNLMFGVDFADFSCIVVLIQKVAMQIHISSDGVPIYQQIVDQIRFRIVSGVLHCGDELPTIRGLAESLQVNPNTVARAYRELQQEGLVEKRRTTGTFVAELVEQHSLAQRRRLLAPHVDKLLTFSRQFGFSVDELITLVRKRDEQSPRSESPS